MKKVNAIVQGLSVAIMTIALTITSGCLTRDYSAESQRILHPRTVVPAPYDEPTVVEPIVAEQTGVPAEETPVAATTSQAPAITSSNVEENLNVSRKRPPKLDRLPDGLILSDRPPVINRPPAIRIKDPREVRTQTPAKPEAATLTRQAPLPGVEQVSKPLTYKVRKGDTLWEIGYMYNVSMHELAAYNNMGLNDTLNIGRKLTIPPGGKFIGEGNRSKRVAAVESHKLDGGSGALSARTASVTGPKRPLPASGVYIVKSGDNLWDIGRKFGLSVKDLKGLNNLKGDTLQIGQMLILRPGVTVEQPRAAASPPAPKKQLPVGTKYTVKNGDNLWDLGRKFGMTVSELKLLNGLKSDSLQIGQVLILRSVTAAKAPLQSQPRRQQVGALPPTRPAVDVQAIPRPTPAIAIRRTMEHDVDEGDSLAHIAALYSVPLALLKQANPSVESDADLKSGMQLRIPVED
ncbi:MAG: LysM peptidoglycan-binding domain-containing protein [Lentisphaeria bacterium]|nr:LysM peptidoglycan-binding domain-containing protein [Lentisphaeria bacterium]